VLRAVVFDFNGVLLDDEALHERLFGRVLAEEGVILLPGQYRGQLLGLDDRGALRAVLAGSGHDLTAPAIARLVARKATYYQEAIRAERLPLFEGADALVRDCARAGLGLAVVSGALREEIQDALGRAALLGLFKIVVSAEDVERGKPDPEGYRRALTGFNQIEPLPERLIHGHEVVAIDDSPQGLVAAAGAGLATLGVAHSCEPEALRAADHVVPRLRGLTAARLQKMYS
jgi:HAD superfamily hydrolase (TIGR01509 family)